MADIYTDPRTGEYLPRATTDYLEEIVEAARDLADAEDRLYGLAVQAHRHGVSWVMIGFALGVTKQAVQKRFTKPPRGRLF